VVTASVGVLIPVRNEENSIPLVLQDIPAGLNALVVVIDNGSTDETSQIARANGAVVLNEEIPGYGRAMLKGVDYLQDHPVDIVVFLDGDYSDYPQAMEKLIEPITNDGYDLVVSTRLDPLYDRKSLSPHVIYGNKLVVFFMNLLFRTTYTDLGPFRAIRYKSLVQLQMEDLDYGWTVEMQVKAKLKGLKVKEFPVRYRMRVGQSKISGTIKGTVLAGSKMLYTLLKLYSTRRKYQS
jgi:glycosyltransferase involved in cell wall biosynthesis